MKIFSSFWRVKSAKEIINKNKLNSTSMESRQFNNNLEIYNGNLKEEEKVKIGKWVHSQNLAFSPSWTNLVQETTPILKSNHTRATWVDTYYIYIEGRRKRDQKHTVLVTAVEQVTDGVSLGLHFCCNKSFKLREEN